MIIWGIYPIYTNLELNGSSLVGLATTADPRPNPHI